MKLAVLFDEQIMGGARESRQWRKWKEKHFCVFCGAVIVVGDFLFLSLQFQTKAVAWGVMNS